MGSLNRSRKLASCLLGFAGVAAMLLTGCSLTAGDFRLSGTPAVRPNEERTARQRTFDLTASPLARKKGETNGSSKQEASKTSTARVSPDGRWVAYESDSDGVRGVWVARRDGAQARRISGTNFSVLPSWSPDGSRLLFVTRHFTRPDGWSVWIVDMATGRSTRAASIGSTRIAGTSWFPDNRRVCYVSEDRLVILDVSSGATRTLPTPVEARPIVGVPAVSPDGSRVAFAVAGDGVWMASLDDGRVQRLVSERNVDAFAWAPGGRQIAFRSGRDGQWKLYDLEP